ncbi:MAG: TlpA disulfide reductase family protein [Pseudomonadota bacterium]
MKHLPSLTLAALLLAAAPAQAHDNVIQNAGQAGDLDLLFDDEASAEPSSSATQTQTRPSLPSIEVFTLDERKMNLSELNGSPVLIHFWATWCSPCKSMMSDLLDYSDEIDGKVKVVLVSIDEQRSPAKVVQAVERQGLGYFDILWDPNGEAKRALRVVNIPATFLFDAEGNQVLRSDGYTYGNLEPFFEAIAK